MKKCTHCGKEYPDNATVCECDMRPLVSPANPTLPSRSSFRAEFLGGVIRYFKRELSPLRSLGGEFWKGMIPALVVLFLVIGFLMVRDWNSSTGKGSYDKIQVGMSLEEVEKIVGKRLSIPDSERARFTGSPVWYSTDFLQAAGPGKAFKEIKVEFRDGVVVSKSRSER